MSEYLKRRCHPRGAYLFYIDPSSNSRKPCFMTWGRSSDWGLFLPPSRKTRLSVTFMASVATNTAAGTVRDSHPIPYWVRKGHHKSAAKVVIISFPCCFYGCFFVFKSPITNNKTVSKSFSVSQSAWILRLLSNQRENFVISSQILTYEITT